MLVEAYVGEDTTKRLEAISRDMGRPVADLVRSAVDEAALDYFRGRDDDPAHKRPRVNCFKIGEAHGPAHYSLACQRQRG